MARKFRAQMPQTPDIGLIQGRAQTRPARGFVIRIGGDAFEAPKSNAARAQKFTTQGGRQTLQLISLILTSLPVQDTQNPNPYCQHQKT